MHRCWHGCVRFKEEAWSREIISYGGSVGTVWGFDGCTSSLSSVRRSRTIRNADNPGTALPFSTVFTALPIELGDA